MYFITLINVKTPTSVGILTFISMINMISVVISCSAELSMKKIYNLGARTGNGTLAKFLKEGFLGFFYVHKIQIDKTVYQMEGNTVRPGITIHPEEN